MDNYPPGMTMRQFDRAMGDYEECPHGEPVEDCKACAGDDGDRAYDEMVDRMMERRTGQGL